MLGYLHYHSLLRLSAGGGTTADQLDDDETRYNDHRLPVEHPLPATDLVIGEHRHRQMDVPRVPAARVDDVVGELHREEHQLVRRQAQDPTARRQGADARAATESDGDREFLEPRHHHRVPIRLSRLVPARHLRPRPPPEGSFRHRR